MINIPPGFWRSITIQMTLGTMPTVSSDLIHKICEKMYMTYILVNCVIVQIFTDTGAYN